jgi:hypothetical protein
MAATDKQDGSLPDQRRIIRMDAVVWALTTGVMAGLGLFVATNWLVFQGGIQVGKHLGLLANYFIGYSVTFMGSLVGFAYAFVVGFVATWVLVTVYNVVARLRSGATSA